MEIQFSRNSGWNGNRVKNALIERTFSTDHDVFTHITRMNGARIRFTLRTASGGIATTQAHDDVIRALLTLDPDATIRTARAVFEGLADFEAQLKARKSLTPSAS